MAELSRDEWEGWMRLLREDIRGVHDRLDELNGRTRTNERDIAVLQDRGEQMKDPTARYTGLGAVIAAAATFVYQWMHK